MPHSPPPPFTETVPPSYSWPGRWLRGEGGSQEELGWKAEDDTPLGLLRSNADQERPDPTSWDNEVLANEGGKLEGVGESAFEG